MKENENSKAKPDAPALTGGDPAALAKGWQDVPKIAADDAPAFDAYYDDSATSYYRRDANSRYIRATVASLRRFLRSEGLASKSEDGGPSPVDSAIEAIETTQNVAYAGPLAGHKSGAYTILSRRILVTDSPRMIDPKAGRWENLEKVFLDLLGEEQCQFFFGWLKMAVESIRNGLQRPGQALVIAGPVRCGKSLVQALITELLGGRSAKPYAFMTRRTDFNSELFGAEHLMIEDEAANSDPRIRKLFGSEIKGLVVNRDQRCHKKNREALTLKPTWRLSVTLNDDPASLLVLPQLEDGLRDKIILFQAKPVTMPVDTSTPGGEETLWRILTGELPAFVHFLHSFEIADECKDPRFGVCAYHNPDLLELMDAATDETKLLELIDLTVFAGFDGEPWEGLAAELENRLIEKHSTQARHLLHYSSACGHLLGHLERKTSRVTRRTREGRTLWKVLPPPQ